MLEGAAKGSQLPNWLATGGTFSQFTQTWFTATGDSLPAYSPAFVIDGELPSQAKPQFPQSEKYG